jgi:hypothetical protein
LRGATTAYVASASTDAAARRAPPARHTSAARDPSASADNESSPGSADELPPATSHRYVEWNFSGVPDPVTFRRFHDTADYWFGYSNDSNVGIYDPAWECFVVLANDQVGAANAVEAGDGEIPPGPGAGPIAPPPITSEGGRHQCATSLGTRARGQAGGRIPHGAVASRHHRWRSLRARRTRTRVG